jgi:hypothetical protein
MILEVQPDTWQVNEGLHASLAKFLRVTNTGALEDERRAQCATTDDDKLAGLVDPALLRAWMERLRGHYLDASGAVAFQKHPATVSGRMRGRRW